MKLIFFSILGILYLSNQEEKNFTILGYLGKDKTRTYTNMLSRDYAIYLDTKKFNEDIKEIELKISLIKGSIKENIMFYGESPQPSFYNTIFSFNKYKTNDSINVKDFDEYYKIYDKCTLYYKIPKPNERYLYVSIPPFSIRYDGRIEISVSNKLSIVAIIGIVFGAIGFIGLIIIIICCIKRKKTKKIQ